MQVIGLTGGIGSGKSYIAALFAERGARVIDADEVCRRIYEPGSACLAEAVEAFGDEILHGNGTLNRARLGQIVFSDRAALDRLNGIAHKYIAQKIEEQIACFTNGEEKVIIIDAPQLFEAGMDARCDAVISVVAPKEQRLRRITERDAVSKQSALARMAMQHDDAFFRSHSAFVIDNSDGANVRAQVARIYRELTEEQEYDSKS